MSASDVQIRLMTKDDINCIHLRLPTFSRMDTYYEEQEQGQRLVFIADDNTHIVGYVTLHFVSDDPIFSSRAIPEIIDLRVFQPHQNKGIGTALIKACENKARELGWTVIGIGVELAPEYAAAQHLYPKLGYIPIEDVSQIEIWALYKQL